MKPDAYRENLRLAADEYDRIGNAYLAKLIRKWLEDNK